MRRALLGLALTLALATPAAAAPSLVKVGDLDRPLYVAVADNARVFVVEKDGVIGIAGGGCSPTCRRSPTATTGARPAVMLAELRSQRPFLVFLTAKADGSLKIYELRCSVGPNRADPAYRRELVLIAP